MARLQNYTLLPQGETSPLPQKSKRFNPRTLKWIVTGLLATIIVLALVGTGLKGTSDAQSLSLSGESACPQYPPIKAFSSEEEKLDKDISDEINSEEFFAKSVKRLQGAVQIPTESFDDMGKVGNDSRWEIFKDFHKYLEDTFPLV